MPRIGLLERTWYGATTTQWLVALATLGVLYVALSILRRVAVRRLGALAARTATDWDDAFIAVVDRTRPYFLFTIALYASTRAIPMSAVAERVLHAVYVIVTLVQAAVWGNALIGTTSERYLRRRTTEDAGSRTTIQAMSYATRFVLWALLLVTGLQNFGVNVTALVTGLGIGGIAIALAIQNILGDLFSALAIVLDKPFVVGDFIIVDDVLGTVEHVGIKTTRLRSLGGEQIVIGNSDLLKSRVRNYKRMRERRILFQLDVTYDTSPETMARIPGMVREIVARQPNVRFDRCHFLAFGESALRVEVVYYVLDPDYNVYADTQHAINLELLRRFGAESIEFAFPSRTVYLQPTTT